MDPQQGCGGGEGRRIAGIAFGLGAQALFGVCIWRLFWFLHGDLSTGEIPEGDVAFAAEAVSGLNALLFDAALAVQFAVSHSLLLWPPVQKRLKRWIAGEFYGSAYSVVACLSLLLLFSAWQTSPVVLWRMHGLAVVGMHAGFYVSWGALFYSLSLTGFGYQTGWTQWCCWFFRRTLPRRAFQPRGAYLWFRHPIYASFLGLLWFTPTMTLDHAVLTGLWTVYLLYGSYLKDERLAFFLGDDYRRYQAAVPGYPGLPLGSLGRRPLQNEPALALPRGLHPMTDTLEGREK
ncbi:MAG: hypothetical protein RIC55_34845 [Pirellulaceae bacterium]